MKLTVYTILISIGAALAIEGLNLLPIYPLAILAAVPALWIPAKFRPSLFLLSGMPMGAEGACWLVAGISYLFNAPVAAIIFIFELFLVEHTLRNLLLVTLSAVIGAALHIGYKGSEAVFQVPGLMIKAAAIPVYIISGAGIGLLGYLLSKIGKLKIPFIAGVAVIGALGWWMPDGLGNGFNHIAALLAGKVTLQLVFGVCIVRLLMLAVADAAGVTGSRVTPLILIGAGLGLFSTMGLIHLFPGAGMTPAVGAIAGMVAMLTGGLRIWLAVMILALEATHQWQLGLPVICAVTPAYGVVWLFERNGKG
jgi:H+/Cl- antiporter ClcA